MADLGDRSIVPQLVANLGQGPGPPGSRWPLAGNSARVLGRLKATEAVSPLIDTLQHNQDGATRGGTAEALGMIGDRQAVLPLIAAMQDPSWTYRRCAAEALGRLGDDRAVEPLIDQLSDDYCDDEAIDALGKLRSPKAVDPLVAIAVRPSPWTPRPKIIKVLEAIGSPDALPALRFMAVRYPEDSAYLRDVIRRLSAKAKNQPPPEGPLERALKQVESDVSTKLPL
jgi:hypothetical protein